MNSDGIFYVDGGELRPLVAKPYETEDLLQRALVDFPDLLAGSVTNDENRRSVLLVKREKGVPVAEAASNTFSIDHLFVDADGIPVLVEVKRRTDTRIRREVVGQMLDYAANAQRYWPVNVIQEEFAKTHGERANELLVGFSQLGPDLEKFWSAVEQNLRDGNIRMLFVADGFPDELVRVIEFLNEQMTPAEVLGVEVKQYVGGSHRVLVPRVIGATSAAVQTKRSRSKTWTRSEFVGFIDALTDPVERSNATRLFSFADNEGARLSLGAGAVPRVSVWHSFGDVDRYTWLLDVPVDVEGSASISVWRGDLVGRFGQAPVDQLFTSFSEYPGLQPLTTDTRQVPSVSIAELTEADVNGFMQGIRDFTATARVPGDPLTTN